MELGYRMMYKGYRTVQEDKLYFKWLLDQDNKLSFGDYCKVNIKESYRKSTQEEKEYILEKYGGGS